MKNKTKFKEWCSEKRYTAKRISEDTGISMQSVYSYMEGKRNPSRNTQKLFEEKYGVNSRDIFPL